MEQIFIIVGSSIFGILGTAHLLLTFCSNKFQAYDSNVTEAMKHTSPVLTKETTMWRAWIGFNASHSLGAMLLAGVYIPLSIFHFDVLQQSAWFSLLPIIFALAFLVLAKKYWFKIPFFGVLLSTMCFTVAAILIQL